MIYESHGEKVESVSALVGAAEFEVRVAAE